MSSINLSYFERAIVLALLLFSSIVLSKTNEFEYHIQYLGEREPHCINITTKVSTDEKGEILLSLPKQPINIAFQAINGQITYKALDGQKIALKNEPYADVEANYKVCALNPQRSNLHPIIENDFLMFVSESLLIMPGEDLDTEVIAKFTFDDFPKKHQIVTNHFLNNRKYETTTTIRALSRSILASGEFDIKTHNFNNDTLHIVFHGNWSMFKKNELINDLKKTFNVQKKFFNDHNFPYFVMLIYDNKQSNVGGVNGSLYENVLTMLVVDSEQKNKPILLGLLSHELFHSWLGNRIRIPEPQGDLQWFFEGVNDFYGWQLALESGVISDKDYLRYYNRLIKEYELSLFKEAQNSQLAINFDLTSPTAKLAMHRGHIAFVEILNELVRQNKGRVPIDQALREILINYANQTQKLTPQSLDGIFRKHLGSEIWERASRVIYDGQLVDFSSKFFLRNVKLKTIIMDVPDLSFDVSSLVNEKRINRLVKGSNAEHAGLQENDKVTRYDIDMTRVSVPVHLYVEGKQGPIKFIPEAIERNMPQYRKNADYLR